MRVEDNTKLCGKVFIFYGLKTVSLRSQKVVQNGLLVACWLAKGIK
jgi:O-acetylhomoserine/O-acetylserine sulfhydrylase-like pyridoxal-dependent enzyme